MARILMVLTSHGELGSTGRKTGLWLEEFAAPFYAFLAAGCEVVLASPRGGAVPVDPGSLADSAQTEATRRWADDDLNRGLITRTLPLSSVTASDFDAVFYPGGHGPMWDLAGDPGNAAVLSQFWCAGKPVGAVCHGVAALLAARDADGQSLLEGRHVTGFSDAEERAVGLDEVVPFLLQDRLLAARAIYEEAPPFKAHTVVDGRLVTGQNPASSVGAAHALLGLLTSE
ncbi:MAG: type 1 glutamine amidotransferase domain-containing protein [Burkholderiaceae bacterium]